MLFLSLAQCPCAAGKAAEAKAVHLTTKANGYVMYLQLVKLC